MTRLVALLTLLALALGSAVGPATAEERRVPSREQWLEDVDKVMKGSGAYLRERTESGETGLAVNFDIDNSSIASYYDGHDAGAIPRVMKFAALAQSLGVVLVFNTGRLNTQQERTIDQLTGAGYDVAMLCMRKKGETIPHGKQRCRNKFIRKGYTLIANVGNNPTDFTGDGYEKAYRLPNYGGELG